MAEATAETFMELAPNQPKASSQRRLVYVKGTTAAGNDTITVPNLTTVEGATLISTAGVSAAPTFATNVITITAAAGTYSGLAWGT